MKKYLCIPCGYIYDLQVGDPENNISPGTPKTTGGVDLPLVWSR